MAVLTRLIDLKISNLSHTTISVFVKRDYQEKDYNSSYDRHFIFSDEDGNTMEAYISKDIAKKYENAFKEGEYYRISNFAVKSASLFCRITNLPVEIFFIPETTYMLDHFMRPLKKYSFCEFVKVLDGSQYISCPGVDLLGVVVKVSKLTTSHNPHLNRPPRPHLDFTLRDVDGSELRCTAWGSLAIKFEVAWTNFRRRDMTLCALRLWKIDSMFGNYTINSRGCASEFLLNPGYYEAYLAEKRFIMDPEATKVEEEYEQEESDDDYYP